jgi:prepilin-type processing-associated H-X9-DG protein
LLPAVHGVREGTRRAACGNNVRQLALALLNYDMQNAGLPAATKTTDQAACQDCFDPWGEAGRTPGSFSAGTKHGTSWVVDLLPFIEQRNIADRWDWETNVRGNAAIAQVDIPMLYCPSRRGGIRVGMGDHLNLLDPSWQGGGTDYGGCYGRLHGFVADVADRHRFYDMSETSVTPSIPTATAPQVPHASGLLDGLFHATLRRPTSEAQDGVTNVILVGEMQRLRPSKGSTGLESDSRTSFDGWAVGGVATLFIVSTDPHRANPGGINNFYFASPGSDHEGGANFALGDGSVRFISEFVDAKDNAAVLPLLGSLSDGEIASVDAMKR